MRKFQAIHDITIWRSLGVDRYGQPNYQEPITIRGRWEDAERLYINENGREVRGRSTVYLPEDLAKSGDYMMLGVSEELRPTVDSYEVKQRRVINSQRGNRKECRYIL